MKKTKNKNFKKFRLLDHTANNSKIYIAEDSSNVELKANSVAFDTEDEVLDFQKEIDPNKTWSYIEHD